METRFCGRARSRAAGNWNCALRDGKLLRVLVPKELNYRRLLGIDEQSGWAYFVAGENPTQALIYRVALDESRPPERVTSEAGVYSAIVSEESGIQARSWQTLSGDPKSAVFDRDGRQIAELTSKAEQPALPPRVELVTVGDDPVLHAAVVRPSDFQPGKKYPVIVHVYGGPGAQTVTAARGAVLAGPVAGGPRDCRGIDRRPRHTGGARLGAGHPRQFHRGAAGRPGAQG